MPYMHSNLKVNPDLALAIQAFMARRTLVLVEPRTGGKRYLRLRPLRRQYLRSQGLLCRKVVAS